MGVLGQSALRLDRLGDHPVALLLAVMIQAVLAGNRPISCQSAPSISAYCRCHGDHPGDIYVICASPWQWKRAVEPARAAASHLEWRDRVDKAIFFSVIITIAAFCLFTMQGVEGQFRSDVAHLCLWLIVP